MKNATNVKVENPKNFPLIVLVSPPHHGCKNFEDSPPPMGGGGRVVWWEGGESGVGMVRQGEVRRGRAR